MYYTKTIVTLVFSSLVFISCKDSASKEITLNDKAKSEKKVTHTAVKPETASFTINGMTCSFGCAKTIEEKLSKMEGVQKATVDFDKKEALIEFDASVLTSEKLAKAVETTGDGNTYKVTNIKTKVKA